MKKIVLPLSENSKRPVITVMGLEALVDTGAELSVFNMSSNVFERLFEYKDKSKSGVTGYGGECYGTKYIVKTLKIGNEITLSDVPFFVPDTPTTEHILVLAATAFEGTIYEIDTLEHRLTISIP